MMLVCLQTFRVLQWFRWVTAGWRLVRQTLFGRVKGGSTVCKIDRRVDVTQTRLQRCGCRAAQIPGNFVVGKEIEAIRKGWRDGKQEKGRNGGSTEQWEEWGARRALNYGSVWISRPWRALKQQIWRIGEERVRGRGQRFQNDGGRNVDVRRIQRTLNSTKQYFLELESRRCNLYDKR